MISQHKQSSISLLSLPFDMILAIFCFIPDVPSLRAFISTCTTLHRTFHNDERLVTESVLLNQMGCGLLREAYMLLESSHLKSCWSKKAVEDFVQRQKVIVTTGLRGSWTLSGGIYVDKIYKHAQYFAADFASSACSEMYPLNSGNGDQTVPPPPSASEIHRMERNFFRFELYCNIFRNYKTVNEKRFSPEEQREVFLKQFPPWEVEQLVCVRDYLLRYIADAFNDMANHDIMWGLQKIDFIDYGPSPPMERASFCREHFLSIGLEYLYRLGSARTYDERYNLLSTNAVPESDNLFLESALQAKTNESDGPNYCLDEYTPDDILLLKNKPFASSSGGDNDENSSGPYEAWRWAYEDYDHLCFYFADEHWSLRRKAYVMWDLTRLSRWEPFKQSWDGGNEPEWLGLSIAQRVFRVESRRKSIMERKKIFNVGGRGWWALGDESKIEWGHTQYLTQL